MVPICMTRSELIEFSVSATCQKGKGKGKGLHSYIRQRGQLSYSIKSQARGNMKLMYVEEKNE